MEVSIPSQLELLQDTHRALLSIFPSQQEALQGRGRWGCTGDKAVFSQASRVELPGDRQRLRVCCVVLERDVVLCILLGFLPASFHHPSTSHGVGALHT